VTPSSPSRERAPVGAPLAVIAGLFLASLALRPQLLAIGPLLPLIREDLGLSASIAGLMTTIPVLCMGIFAPIGPRVAARLGPHRAFAVFLATIIGFGFLRTLGEGPVPVILATFGIGVGIGMAGAVPSMVVSSRLPGRPALGTGAYAAGIVAGSTLAAALAVPLAVDADWRLSLAMLSIASVASLVAWLILVPADPRTSDVRRPRARGLPWGSATAWLLVLVFGLQSILFYGIVAWLPNVYVERGWTPAAAGSLVAVFNGIGLITTISVPLVADRLGRRRPQLLVSAIASLLALGGLILVPEAAYLMVAILGLALGIVFPLSLTLPLDVSDDPTTVGAVAALMLFGGYSLSSLGPLALGIARDLSGDFAASLLLLLAVNVVLVVSVAFLSPARLHRGVGRAAAT
jgi:MFS transporter, CP family, cyanate transporter